MAVFVFDIETVPDVELGRRVYGLHDLSDKQVGYVMQAKRREESGSRYGQQCHAGRDPLEAT